MDAPEARAAMPTQRCPPRIQRCNSLRWQNAHQVDYVDGKAQLTGPRNPTETTFSPGERAKKLPIEGGQRLLGA
eukprot:223025-Chlamydomonas_euryale.AAC.2